jgi:hypothetical protein
MRLLPGSKWKAIRAEAVAAARGACVVCGEVREKGMIGDEEWLYEDGVATLTGVRLVCPDCNGVTHIGSTSARGYFDQARDHMAAVNGITADEADRLIDAAFREWSQRSRLTWRLAVSPDLLARFPELVVLEQVGPLGPAPLQ